MVFYYVRQIYNKLYNQTGKQKRICVICTIALLAALITVCTALALPIRASAEPVDPITDRNITYTLEENGDDTYTMTVSGSGEIKGYIYDYDVEKRPFNQYADKCSFTVKKQATEDKR